ncbi:hypothetical protein [Pseudomonas chlororaphis]|uniref:hypothetical protein n=1 Tax=Pseudomonas chlororaphis TaxID=587753 RepID=UPI0007B37154|nr:hypothetical protein [Pseudomonas chlororaphis]AZC63951.1 hypothetical protein C4K33_3460 [Pseudomonas chlororaphis subsp. piscium]AZC82666.1 hypothetical protein C4K30_3553 [Pseudomonas chlororaphis subsp. piscium]AZC89862.1 hypothetical protein C4K29_3562 [Pseudomonas chlororaphis subsp. piscium]KZO48712.1 hypothetical protein PCL1391_3212 [Pseudomonas chlororaphis subsp. piscium]MBP5069284.1 hypothetical protein [Pseudomonas chlororaphis]
MSTTKITINALSAINLTNLSESGSGAITVNLATGKYAVTLSEDTMKYGSGSAYIQQVILFSTTPLKDGNYEKWFYTVNTSEGTVIKVDGDYPVYVFIVDQLNVRDNSGSATVTFTPV